MKQDLRKNLRLIMLRMSETCLISLYRESVAHRGNPIENGSQPEAQSSSLIFQVSGYEFPDVAGV